MSIEEKMGRLIDETNLMNLLYALDDARHELFYAIKKIPELPTVEAIPKDQYEARLKADMVAMLTELQLKINELDLVDYVYAYTRGAEDTRDYIANMLEEKINKLKETD